MNPLYPVTYALFGTVTGSFLNVCIIRIPRGEAFVTGRSRCSSCQRQLPAIDMISVPSWLFLGGECCFCHTAVSLQYPIVEAGDTLIFYLCCLVKGPGAESVILCTFASLLTVATWIDARYLYIPDGVHILTLPLGLASIILCRRPGTLERMAGSFIYSGFLEILRILTRGGMGGGDVKLLASSGSLLGARTGAASVFMAYVIAGLWYLIPPLRGWINDETSASMAPFLGLSLMVCGLQYGEIITWYLGLFLP